MSFAETRETAVIYYPRLGEEDDVKAEGLECVDDVQEVALGISRVEAPDVQSRAAWGYGRGRSGSSWPCSR